MARSDIHVGVEIGTTKIAVVVAEVKADGTIKILGTSTAGSRGVRKGEIIDVRQVQTCLHDALYRAEDRSEVRIRNVLLAVTGGHIQCQNNRGVVSLPEDQNEITPDHLEEVRRVGLDVALPRDHRFLHGVLQHYYVDGVEKVVDPVGRLGGKLEAGFHIVHGNRNRLMNTVNCVRELTIDVQAIIFSPLAAAQIGINREARERGAILVDIGGGTTDFCVYRDGALVLSGCIPVGGDHITNDIATVLGLPLAKAEKLKIDEGSAMPGDEGVTEFITLEGDPGFVGRTVRREELDGIINARVEEIFELLHERIEDAGGLAGLGAGLVLAGGTSRLVGIDRAAQGVFRMPVIARRPGEAAGTNAAFEDSTFWTALGLIRFTQIVEQEKRGTGGLRGMLGRLFSSIRSWFF
jgi:cell division protein FtsA